MKVVFRADASLQIGNGHVMRCLTLAAALRKQGTECHFICREHPGNLIDQVRNRGFAVAALAEGHPNFQPATQDDRSLPTHAPWLGVDWQTDAEATRDVLQSLSPDWLVVDHYALDYIWEQALRSHCAQLMAIDDLADRPHDCDILLDQNLSREAADYAGLVPATCRILAGTRYALLRPEFSALREYSLRRRSPPHLQRLLITMGGADQSDAAGRVLDVLRRYPLPHDCHITVIMGPHAPWLEQVQARTVNLPWPCDVKVGVDNMAELMADSDLAIGAAGGTSWERCVLGLPALIVITAENQRPGAMALSEAHAAIVIGEVNSIEACLPKQISALDGTKLAQLSEAASLLVDGHGTLRVMSVLLDSCRIRPMHEKDLANVLQWRNHPDIRRFMYTQHEIALDEHLAWYEQALKDRRRHLLIVEDHCEPLGFVQFTEQGDGVAEWGFYAAPGMPKGSGQKLGSVALNHAFQRLGFHKVCGEAIAFNDRSIAFHRKLGFQDASVLRDGYFDGERYHDVYRFVMLADEWNERHRDSKL
jgi:UDP-2,4-diacetamido-2,4,6-trideoxy-beta-L-altropyranose hydrolase